MFNQTGCPCLNRGSHNSNSCSTARSTHLTKRTVMHKQILTSMGPGWEQHPAGHRTISGREQGAALSPSPSPTYGFRRTRLVWEGGCKLQLALPWQNITTVRSEHCHAPGRGSRGTCAPSPTRSLSQKPPECSRIEVPRQHGQPYPGSQHHQTGLSQAALNISMVQNRLWSDKMFPHRHDDRNELSRWSWLILLLLALGILGGGEGIRLSWMKYKVLEKSNTTDTKNYTVL